jgi:hypothetical protein
MIGTDVVGQLFASLADSDASRPRHARGDAAAAGANRLNAGGSSSVRLRLTAGRVPVGDEVSARRTRRPWRETLARGHRGAR